jgi:hypothetical protein
MHFCRRDVDLLFSFSVRVRMHVRALSTILKLVLLHVVDVVFVLISSFLDDRRRRQHTIDMYLADKCTRGRSPINYLVMISRMAITRFAACSRLLPDVPVTRFALDPDTSRPLSTEAMGGEACHALD